MKISRYSGILILAVSVATARGGDNNETYARAPILSQTQADVFISSLPGQIVKSLPGQFVPALPGQVVKSLPGQMVQALPGQIVGPLHGSADRALHGQIVLSFLRPSTPLPGKPSAH